MRPPQRIRSLARAVERQDGKCFWCDDPFDDNDPPTREHFPVAKSAGGNQAQSNIVAAHFICNWARHHKLPLLIIDAWVGHLRFAHLVECRAVLEFAPDWRPWAGAAAVGLLPGTAGPMLREIAQRARENDPRYRLAQ